MSAKLGAANIALIKNWRSRNVENSRKNTIQSTAAVVRICDSVKCTDVKIVTVSDISKFLVKIVLAKILKLIPSHLVEYFGIQYLYCS